MPRRALQAIVAVPAMLALLLLGQAASASTTVNCETGGDLQAAITTASSGETILVKGTCHGSFTITSKGLTLKGNPKATLDGDDVFRPLGVNNTGAPSESVHLIDLTVTGGVVGSPGGGGILKIGGSLSLDRVTVTNNLAISSSGPVAGGGIFDGGNATITNSTISGNRARTTASGGEADGGGIATVGGNLTVTSSRITGNRATSKLTSGTATARGGGLYEDSGTLTLQGSTVSGNRVTASGPANVFAQGAGFSANSTSVDTVSGSALTKNTATADSSTGFAFAGGGGYIDDTAHVTGSVLAANVLMASGSTATAAGGGLSAEQATLSRSTVNGNRVAATTTGGDALVQGGGVGTDGPTKLSASTVSRNISTARTSAAANAGAYGGGIDADAVDASNSTIALNRLTASSPSVGGSSTVHGGGINAFTVSATPMIDSTVAGNVTSAAGGTVTRQGGGLYTSSMTTLEGTIIANNTALQGPDCFGGPTSNGHNLIRKTAGCSFSKTSTDKVSKNPKLGPLASNGGPTQTMAIVATSPAFNAIPKAACAVHADQRGVHRPQGTRCDIGAYELKITSIAIP
jgi:fibronectin-binding autotransporter adhesin